MTSKELAKLLNLSPTAVSFALNRKPGVSTETRRRVLEAAEKYKLDTSKANYSTKPDNGSICLVYFRKQGAVLTDTPFFSELSEGIENYCTLAGYRVNIKNVYNNQNIQKQFEDISFSGADGIILIGTEMNERDFRYLAFLKIPVVLVDNHFISSKIDSILINNIDGAYTATNYLINKKSCQPGYLHSSYPINNFAERSTGFYKAIQYNGMPRSKSIVHNLTPSIEGAYSDMLTILENNEEIATAYFADNDLIAIGAMKAFKEKGYHIPEDISIIGFDDISMCNYVEPPLTTVNVPKKYLGRMAAERLISILNEQDFYPVTIQIATNLVIRKSIL